MANLERLKELGSGTLRFRLVIEGCPVEWVTDLSITHATGKDGRRVVLGLSVEGLTINDSIVLREAELESESMTFTINPSEPIYVRGFPTDRTLQAFTTYPTPTWQLDPAAGDYSATDTTAPTVIGGTAMAAGDIIHIGTETIRIVTLDEGGSAVSRHIWDTQPQAHVVSRLQEDIDVFVYLTPPTLEGRRVFLYAYEGDDDPAGNGTIIWRGFVGTPPTLAPDGTSWRLETLGVTQALNQKAASALGTAHVIGINHHNCCAAAWSFIFNGVFSTTTHADMYKYTGHDITEHAMVDSINAAVADSITDFGEFDTVIESLKLIKLSDGSLTWRLTTNSSWDPDDSFSFVFVSPIFGASKRDNFVKDLDDRAVAADGFAASKNYTQAIVQGDAEIFDGKEVLSYEGAPVMPLGNAFWLMAPSVSYLNQATVNSFKDSSAAAVDRSPWRIYIDTDYTGVEWVYISGTTKPDGIFEVIDTGGEDGKFWILVGSNGTEGWSAPQSLYQDPNGWQGAQLNHASGGFLGWLGSDVEIKAYRMYGVGDIGDLIDSVKDLARDFANAGDVPFLTDADIADFTLEKYISAIQAVRMYGFVDPEPLYDVFRQECLFLLHFMRIEADGRIGLAPLPTWSNASKVAADHVFDDDVIITPEDGQGAFPTYEPNRDGRVTQMTIRHEWLPITDSYSDDATLFQDVEHISLTKTRGSSPLDIATLSQPLFKPSQIKNLELKREIAKRYFALFSLDYVITQVCVSFKCFGILLGDLVSVTSPHIPDGAGLRGITNRRGLVIGRQWPLDGAEAGYGTLTVLLTPPGIVGYAPSGRVTAVVSITGDHWVFEVGNLHADNQMLAGNIAGDVVIHFSLGDRVVVFLLDDDDGGSRGYGVIESIDYDLYRIGILFDDPYDILVVGTNLFIEFCPSSEANENQLQYCYIADNDLVIETPDDDIFARRFS